MNLKPLFLIVLFFVVCCRNEPVNQVIKIDEQRTFYGCPLDKEKNNILFKHNQKACAVPSRYEVLEIPLKYVASCIKYKNMGSDSVHLKMSYPTLKAINNVSTANIYTHPNLIEIFINSEPCDLLLESEENLEKSYINSLKKKSNEFQISKLDESFTLYLRKEVSTYQPNKIYVYEDEDKDEYFYIICDGNFCQNKMYEHGFFYRISISFPEKMLNEIYDLRRNVSRLTDSFYKL
jgi:hypothetical protein